MHLCVRRVRRFAIPLVPAVDSIIIIICWFVLSDIYLVRYVDYIIIIICWFVLSDIYLLR